MKASYSIKKLEDLKVGGLITNTQPHISLPAHVGMIEEINLNSSNGSNEILVKWFTLGCSVYYNFDFFISWFYVSFFDVPIKDNRLKLYLILFLEFGKQDDWRRNK